MEPLSFPKKGQSADSVLKELSEAKANDVDWQKGRAFSLVYHVNDEHYDFVKKAHNTFFSENSFHSRQSVPRFHAQCCASALKSSHLKKRE